MFLIISASRPVAVIARAHSKFKIVSRPKMRDFECSTESHQSKSAFLGIIRANQRLNYRQSLLNRCVSARKQIGNREVKAFAASFVSLSTSCVSAIFKINAMQR